MNIPDYTKDDYYGHAAEGLCSAALCFDSSKGKFKSLAVACIRNRINAERTRSMQIRDGQKSSFVEVFIEDEQVKYDLEEKSVEVFKNNLNLEGTFSDFFRTLNSREVKIVSLIGAGYTYEEISKRIGLSVSGIKKIVKKIRRKIND